MAKSLLTPLNKWFAFEHEKTETGAIENVNCLSRDEPEPAHESNQEIRSNAVEHVQGLILFRQSSIFKNSEFQNGKLGSDNFF